MFFISLSNSTNAGSDPIIALTADVTTVDLAKCKAVGMNDYLAKPVDERELYSKIVSQIKVPIKNGEAKKEINLDVKKLQFVNLEYLSQRTKSNSKLMVEMIAAYLEQTPPLIKSMKQSFQDKDWNLLQAAVHKMIPSFSIIGMSNDFENMAKKIHEYAIKQLQHEELDELVLQLENACTNACRELESELERIKILN